MPTYAYACTACDNRFEVQQSFTDDALTECPRCAARLRKLFNSVGIVFKGSGFYRTDSRSGSNGAGTNGAGTNGAGTNGAGTNGAGTNGDSGSGSSSAASSGKAASSDKAASSASGSSSSGSSSSRSSRTAEAAGSAAG